jgi:hypothetical protein
MLAHVACSGNVASVIACFEYVFQYYFLWRRPREDSNTDTKKVSVSVSSALKCENEKRTTCPFLQFDHVLSIFPNPRKKQYYRVLTQ